MRNRPKERVFTTDMHIHCVLNCIFYHLTMTVSCHPYLKWLTVFSKSNPFIFSSRVLISYKLYFKDDVINRQYNVKVEQNKVAISFFEPSTWECGTFYPVDYNQRLVYNVQVDTSSCVFLNIIFMTTTKEM